MLICLASLKPSSRCFKVEPDLNFWKMCPGRLRASYIAAWPPARIFGSTQFVFTNPDRSALHPIGIPTPASARLLPARDQGPDGRRIDTPMRCR
jgi:hypothetical protein